jgi:nicotinate-nucleotide adenylyltransferase
MKKIGIFGGTFDPLHLGHLRVAAVIQNEFELDKVIFIPARVPPHKEEPNVSAKDRYKMVEAAIKGQTAWEISDIELNRAGKSFTLDTLKSLQEQEGEDTALYYIMGADAMKIFPTWHEPLEIMQIVKNLLVVSRPGFDFYEVEKFLSVEPFAKFRNKVQLVPMNSIDVSASAIRQVLNKKEDISELLPAAVIEYIKENDLYS